MSGDPKAGFRGSLNLRLITFDCGTILEKISMFGYMLDLKNQRMQI